MKKNCEALHQTKQSKQAPLQLTHYRAMQKNDKFERIKIDKMLTGNIIEPAETSWTSPIIFAPREDDTVSVL